jgi:formylmethanofuran dehydrogenase subunit E
VDSDTERAVRIVPHPNSREQAELYASDAPDRWHAQRDGYMLMPDEGLLQAWWVTLGIQIREIVSEPKRRVTCVVCGEEIINHRETFTEGRPHCRRCAGEDSYYALTGAYAGKLPLYIRSRKQRSASIG